MGKAFGISFAATFGSMAGLLAFGIAAEKYLDHRDKDGTLAVKKDRIIKSVERTPDVIADELKD